MYLDSPSAPLLSQTPVPFCVAPICGQYLLVQVRRDWHHHLLRLILKWKSFNMFLKLNNFYYM